MRIAIDATSIPPKPTGVGNYLINLVRSLDHQPLEEEVLVFAHHRNVPLFGTLVSPNLKIIPIADKSPAMRLIWEQVGLPLLVRRYRVNVLHSPHYTIPLIASCRRVVTFHDLTFFLYPELHTFSKRLFFRLMAHLSSRLSDAIITISQNTRQDMIRVLQTPPEKITPIPLGVGAEFTPNRDPNILFRVKHEYQLSDRFFLYVGTLEPRKNIPMVISAFQRYCQSGGDADLILVGQKGWMVDDLINRLQAEIPGGRLRWLEYVPQNDLPILYNAALALIYPTFYEGFGLPPLEAMACGTPVISSDVGAIRELVDQAGLLFSPNDEEGFARGMTTLANDEVLRQALRERGLKRASLYSWDKVAQQTLNLYRRVSKQKGT